MIQEDKELLLKDLCARLNTNLVCSIYRTDDQGIGYRNEILYGYCNINGWNEFYFGEDCGISIDDISKIKPYLRPMSSMTEEEFTKVKEYGRLEYDQLDLVTFQNSTYKCLDFYLNGVPSGAVIRVFDWLNKYHFDYRDLIQMGLAIDVTKVNNPY